jgi:hypothetical protein
VTLLVHCYEDNHHTLLHKGRQTISLGTHKSHYYLETLSHWQLTADRCSTKRICMAASLTMMFSTSIWRIRVQTYLCMLFTFDQQVKVPLCNLEQSSVLLSVMLLKRHRFSTQKQSLQFYTANPTRSTTFHETKLKSQSWTHCTTKKKYGVNIYSVRSKLIVREKKDRPNWVPLNCLT